MHWKWRWCGWETLPVHTVGIKSATVRSLCKLERREDKGEGRGFARQGRRAGDRVPKRRKRRKGVWYGDEGMGSRADRRGSAQYTRAASVARCHGHARTGC